MARFVTGGAEHPQAKKGRKGGFTPTLAWKDGDVKYVQFVTPFDERIEVLMHQFIKVGVTKEGKDKLSEFVSRTDIAFEDEPNYGYDPILDRFGVEPKLRTLAVAVEMEPVTERVNNRAKIVGYKPTTRTYETKDGVEHTVVDQKLVNQSDFIFFGTLKELDEDRPVNEHVWKIKRTGASNDTRYTFLAADEAIDLGIPDDQKFDLPGYVTGLASLEHYKVIEKLPANARISRYGQPAPGVTSGAVGEPGSVTENDAEPEEMAPSDRESRFNAFKDAIEK